MIVLGVSDLESSTLRGRAGGIASCAGNSDVGIRERQNTTAILHRLHIIRVSTLVAVGYYSNRHIGGCGVVVNPQPGELSSLHFLSRVALSKGADDVIPAGISGGG